jgi:hypothetical protein
MTNNKEWRKTSVPEYENTLKELLLGFVPIILPLFQEGTQLTNPNQLIQWETKLREIMLEAEARIAQEVFTTLFNNPKVVYLAKQAIAKTKPKLRDAGKKSFRFTCLSGKEIMVRTQYFDTRNLSEKEKKKKGEGKKGSFPVPEFMGIIGKVTPALGSEIAQAVMEGPSMKWAKTRLLRQGIAFSTKKVRKIAKQVALNALKWRKAFQNGAITEHPLNAPDDLTGKVVKIDVDGGRIRTRVTNRGRKRKNGRRGFKRDWTEPLIFTITVLDSDGKKLKSHQPFYDGTIKGVDAMFSLLESYLSWMHIENAAKVQFAADGDKKLWPRFKKLAKRLALPKERVFMVLDYPHAVQHLWQIMDLKSSWSREEKEACIQKMKDLLFEDKIDLVIDLIEMLAHGRNARKIKAKLEYFKRYRDQMLYGTMKKNGLGTGSGTVESAIRRIVNLRLKAPGSFWKRDSLEGYVMLRSYLMAGRWDDLINWSVNYSKL